MKLSEGLSHAVLAGTSIYCINQSPNTQHPLDLVAYGSAALSSLFAVLEDQTDNDAVETISNGLDFAVATAYPLLVGKLWLNYGYELYIGYCHPIVTTLVKLLGEEYLDMHDSDSLILTSTLNEISCAYLGYLKNNQDAYIGTAIFLATYLMAKKVDWDDRATVMNCGLAATFFFMMRANQNAK